MDLHQRATFDGSASLGDRLQHGIERLQGNFCQESERSQVDAQQGNIDCGRDPRGGEQGSIAAKHHHEVERLRRHLGPWNDLLTGDIFRGLVVHDDFVAMLGQPGEQAGKNLRDLRAIGPGDNGCGFLG